MSESAAANDRIIHPAPAQCVVSAGNQQPQNNPAVDAELEKAKVRKREAEEKQEQQEQREKSIKNLNKKLRMVNNICGPLCDYFKFQRNLNPEIRALIDLNQWMMLMFALKAAVKSQMDYDYMDIVEPPDNLKTAMANAYNNLDAVSDSYTESMKEIVKLHQNKSNPSAVVSNPSQPIPKQDNVDVLSSMTDSRLPQ